MKSEYLHNQLLPDLFQAYYDARKNKRNTINQLRFEMDYENHLFELYDQIKNYKYKVSRSICFIVDKPVKREIFAADFRDRVVQHLIYNDIYSIYDRRFIYDSYSCRINKGTHFGINRISRFMRAATNNFKYPAYVLKLDIEGYFMSINRKLLFQKIIHLLSKSDYSLNHNFKLFKYLIEQTLLNDPTDNCIIKGEKSDWNGLPKSKSLFHANEGCGLAIGNLTSQLYSNIFLNDFDHFVKSELQIKYYGRYVDDFVIIHNDLKYLKSLIFPIKEFLASELYLKLHPRKIYIQECAKGLAFLGAVIKPYRNYSSKRVKSNFYESIIHYNTLINKTSITEEIENKFIASMNSYIGLMEHYKSHKLLKKILSTQISPKWQKHIFDSNNKGYNLINRYLLSDVRY